ncbi:hypothetical protein AX769_11360 [Frondihabitans sp. PAMC 28766]|uniref:hypothetical protein n=1 Tax=Frondihabitans sp. PAMC 28766 TaxID=1795630 RepID=UPI00078D0B3F|nr:hypothetical protein [Frondihabitans sp. PAMC 28766]AMM20629.1 hypothetical protein AX769_11360 [Frondihabitans sp. PAMC 28766]
MRQNQKGDGQLSAAEIASVFFAPLKHNPMKLSMFAASNNDRLPILFVGDCEFTSRLAAVANLYIVVIQRSRKPETRHDIAVDY